MPLQAHIAMYLILAVIFIMVEILENSIYDFSDFWQPCENAFVVFASFELIGWLIHWGFNSMVTGAAQ